MGDQLARPTEGNHPAEFSVEGSTPPPSLLGPVSTAALVLDKQKLEGGEGGDALCRGGFPEHGAGQRRPRETWRGNGTDC